MKYRILTALLAILVAFSMASDAWARAGKSGSLGSRGTRTYDRPVERSVTPPPAPTAPQAAPTTPGVSQPMYNPNAARPNAGMAQPMAPAAQPGFFQRNPVMGGILGGLVGAGIGSMLFGHSPAMASATDAAPMAGMFGTLLQFALIGGLIWLAVRFFRRRSEAAPAHGPAGYHREASRLPTSGANAGPSVIDAAPRRIEKEFEPSADDQDAFSRIITGVQQAWSDGNPVALRQFATPEVVGWISEDLSRDQSKGVRNVVEDIQLLKGDITESWRDGELEYATAVITFSSKDYVVRLDNGSVVEGDPRTPVEATEAWTFVRSPAGTWLLSAIEQV